MKVGEQGVFRGQKSNNIHASNKKKLKQTNKQKSIISCHLLLSPLVTYIRCSWTFSVTCFFSPLHQLWNFLPTGSGAGTNWPNVFMLSQTPLSTLDESILQSKAEVSDYLSFLLLFIFFNGRNMKNIYLRYWDMYSPLGDGHYILTYKITWEFSHI